MAKSSMIPKGWEVYFKWGLVILGLMIGLPWINKWVKKFKEDNNADAAVAAAAGNVAANNPPANSSAARASKIKGWADSLKACFDSYLNKSSSVVAILNDVLNAADVAALSVYYRDTYGDSLKAKVNEELGSFFNMGKGWKDLKKVVQENLD